jgi:hypothetical protein
MPVHDRGLVSVLRQVHDDLDAAVAEAYGWPLDLPDQEILRLLEAVSDPIGLAMGRNGHGCEAERRGDSSRPSHRAAITKQPGHFRPTAGGPLFAPPRRRLALNDS